MKKIEVTEVKYQCERCGVAFDVKLDCETHEEFCQSKNKDRAIAERLNELITYASKRGIQIFAGRTQIRGTVFDECNGIIELLTY